MSLLTLLNAIANAVLCISVFHVTLFVFGRPDSPIYRNNLAAVLCKVASTITFCGSAANLLSLPTPTWTELVLNIGISLNFLWISYYDRITGVTLKRPPRKRTRSK
jgi:hypothetical protein